MYVSTCKYFMELANPNKENFKDLLPAINFNLFSLENGGRGCTKQSGDPVARYFKYCLVTAKVKPNWPL